MPCYCGGSGMAAVVPHAQLASAGTTVWGAPPRRSRMTEAEIGSSWLLVLLADAARPAPSSRLPTSATQIALHIALDPSERSLEGQLRGGGG